MTIFFSLKKNFEQLHKRNHPTGRVEYMLFFKIAHIITEFFTIETELVFHRKNFCFDLNLQQTESLNMLQQFTG